MQALIYFLLWAGLFYLMMRLGCGAHVTGHSNVGKTHGASGGNAGDLRWAAPETDVDPVCGKTVHTDRAKPSVFDGYVYYFCSRECRELFEAAPKIYVGPTASPAQRKLEHSHG